ncbi:hypothetical protein [Bartonella sp. HY038]|uniref:hypothetical protein n=1 Tax=Bartonella sp. HY038 TaxID=2759660 RepID=UPI0015F78E00|nr:hypothetical protein [Bartonella sp. HY038]
MRFGICVIMSVLVNLVLLQNSQSKESIDYVIHSHTIHTCQTTKDGSIQIKNSTIAIRFLLESIRSETAVDCACTSALLKVSIKNAVNDELIATQIITNETKYNTIEIKDRGYKRLQLNISCHVN